MSVDLFVVRREPALTEPEVRAAMNALAARHDGISRHDRLVCFAGIGRAELHFVEPSAEDLEEGEEPELASPFVVVTARAAAWPWVEWTALTLATELGARVYDPQDGDFHDGPAEHGLAELLAVRDD